MALTSRIPGFYELPLSERRERILSQVTPAPALGAALESLLDGGGLTSASADKIVENVLGIYSLPFGVALNFQVNGRDVLVPMVAALVIAVGVLATAGPARRAFRVHPMEALRQE